MPAVAMGGGGVFAGRGVFVSAGTTMLVAVGRMEVGVSVNVAVADGVLVGMASAVSVA